MLLNVSVFNCATVEDVMMCNVDEVKQFIKKRSTEQRDCASAAYCTVYAVITQFDIDGQEDNMFVLRWYTHILNLH